MYNFIVFSLSRWSIEYGCNIRDISIELSKRHKVLYIDVPLKRKDLWFNPKLPAVQEVKSRIKEGKSLVQVSPTLWHYIADMALESVNSISNNQIFDILNFVNNKRFARVIRKAARDVGFQDFILLNDNDIYNGFYLDKLVKPKAYVYYLRDNLKAMAYWKKQTSRLESLLIQKVDAVVANSQYLADYAKSFNGKSYYVGQGCDVQHFVDPPDKIDSVLESIPGPRVGYIGALNSERLDLDLLIAVAKRMQDFSFVLVGQEDTGFMKSELHQFPNVYFLGKKDFTALPALLYGFDVTINPQRINEITIGNYPRKVDEYLAAGKPVVATQTQAMQPFADYVYLGETASDYEMLIRKARAENSPELQNQRSLFAQGHTWQNNTAEIIKAVDRVYGKKK